MAPTGAGAAVNAVWVNSLPCEPGGSAQLPITGSVVDPGAVVAWTFDNQLGGTPAPGPAGAIDSADLTAGTTSGGLSPDAKGFFSSSLTVDCLGLVPGDVAVYSLSITSNAAPVASGTGAVTATGETPPFTWVPVTPDPPSADIAQPGQSFMLTWKVRNDDLFFPHAFPFVAEADNELAPGLDLYDLTPVSGFDLPTVIGAGTPLMSGKLESILPGDELLVEIEVKSDPSQSPGEGNKVHLTVEDDDSSAKSNGSGNGIVKGIEAPALGPVGIAALLAAMTLGALVAVRKRSAV